MHAQIINVNDIFHLGAVFLEKGCYNDNQEFYENKIKN